MTHTHKNRFRNDVLSASLLPTLHAKSRAPKDEDVSADDEEGDDAPDKKGKPGFRDRKVSSL